MPTFIAYPRSPYHFSAHEIKADYFIEGNNNYGVPTFTFYRKQSLSSKLKDKKISQVEIKYYKVREV